MSDIATAYCIDTSALIHWWVETYSPDVFETIPDKMAGLIADGRLRTSRAVKEEIKDDTNAEELTLAKWCRDHSDFYIEDDEEVQSIVQAIMADVQALPAKPGKGVAGADPFVIAHTEIFGSDWCVVSEERPSNGSKYNPNIPFICRLRNIDHIDIITMMRREGWRL